MSRSPKPAVDVGVALPVFNCERYVVAALESVLAQTYPVSDVVVVDDGSADTSYPLALGVGHPVRVVRQEHAGVGVARSRAVNLVRGEIVVLMDSDDLLTSDSIGTRLQVILDNPDVDIVYGQIRSFTECVGGVPVPLDRPRPAHTPGAMMVRRSAFDRVGPFTAGLRVAEGLDWLLRAHEVGLREATVEEQVQWRRVHGANNSLTQRGSLGELPRTLKASLDRRRQTTARDCR
ncbi:MAG: glycosyltransferase family A protein [Acidimicrobiales bacterium]